MTRKKPSPPSQEVQQLERLDDIKRELKKMNDRLEDMAENRKTEKAEFSFLLSLVGVGISVSSLIVKSLGGDSRVLIVGGGISVLLLILVSSYMQRLSKSRPIPREIIFLLVILFLSSIYSILLGLEII
ncbi:hypothetical protein GF412_03180 [Candidatus Micrarchaeota archaeon]|nr:hypothetical protein [Candidatus Micrarchaeota archaeon]MBD3417956.1 hypothetical protein [Candidatus Micrarchaeota archaeon]